MSDTLDYATPAGPDDPAVLWRPRASVPLILACVYAPYAWVLLIPYPWSDYRILWLKLWPILPGILAAVASPRGTPFRGYLIMGLATAAILAVVLIPFCRPRRRRTVLAVGTAVLALSGGNAFIAYALFRS